MADAKTQDAVLMRLQDIGENFARLREGLPDYWETHGADAWTKAIGLRNIIAHAYGSVDLSTIWNLIVRDLDELRQSVTGLLP